MTEHVHPPFTSDQVRNLNDYQTSGYFHPFTCLDHSGVSLVAAADGWHCPESGCTYTQEWAHWWMADGTYMRSL